MLSSEPSLWLSGLWLSRDLASGPISALQPCNLTQPWPWLWSTNFDSLKTATEFATSQGHGQSGSAALPASVIEVLFPYLET